ncbi:MAG: cobalamin-independent methionine synthase II family protein [Thermoleophilia bacterium]|nr:cobalamin-independent methionine synthase II family protein [Thermoleophilia bacterium]
MPHAPLRTTVVGSFPFPGWLELAGAHIDELGAEDREEAIRDAVWAAVGDQLRAGLDVITDGEQARFDFNLSFYAFLEGLELEREPRRRWGPPAHDQRGRHTIVGELAAPDGLGAVSEWQRLRELAPSGFQLKASVPGPYTLAGRIEPSAEYPDRYAITEALVPVVRDELTRLVDAGCQILTVDEPSMSCYAHREDPERLVDIFNRTVEPVVGRCYLGTHLCFGNFKGRAVAPRRYAPMFPAFLELAADELHLEMASREFAELELIASVGERHDVGVGVVDVKSYYVETPEDVEERVRGCLRYVPAERLSVSPDCGLSQTARWAAQRKLANMVEGARRVRETL